MPFSLSALRDLSSIMKNWFLLDRVNTSAYSTKRDYGSMEHRADVGSSIMQCSILLRYLKNQYITIIITNTLKITITITSTSKVSVIYYYYYHCPSQCYCYGLL